MSHPLTLGYSPCPNDTFIFAALVHNQVPCAGLSFNECLEDVETLNRLALKATLDLTKISYHAFGHVREHYTLLRSGSALGRGCGPLVVAPAPCRLADLRDKTVLIPGELTTATLLLQLCERGLTNLRTLPFDQIMPALQRGEAAAGVIIHESRFTFANYGLHQIIDLGQWWEETTGLPIPLGGILARRDLDPELVARVEQGIRASLEFARAHPQQVAAYIRAHAQELSAEVTAQHIDLYVNDFSLELGSEGEHAVRYLLQQAEERGIIPSCDKPLFAL
ncbi:MAG: 1,4-dihydroxy-6-naphthoate synthase [Desulfuromonadaceae bacterium]|nr:1,4-dihydroxy-6-naphthoate synthase [Desulfuromonadaceae bacterium]